MTDCPLPTCGAVKSVDDTGYCSCCSRSVRLPPLSEHHQQMAWLAYVLLRPVKRDEEAEAMPDPDYGF
jgi:hypothetical protein